MTTERLDPAEEESIRLLIRWPGPNWDSVQATVLIEYMAHLVAEIDALRAENARLAEDAQRWRDAEAEGHIVDFDETGYGLQHPPSCRPNLIGCIYNVWLAEDDKPAMPPGRYRMTITSLNGYQEAEYAALGPRP